MVGIESLDQRDEEMLHSHKAGVISPRIGEGAKIPLEWLDPMRKLAATLVKLDISDAGWLIAPTPDHCFADCALLRFPH